MRRLAIERYGINGWTGGQYSLLRIAFGLYVGAHFGDLLADHPWYLWNYWVLQGADDPILGFLPNVLARMQSETWALIALWSGLLASVVFVLGYWTRIVGPLIGLLWIQVFACLPGHYHASLSAIALLLFSQAFVPEKPFLSLPARGRTDPGGDWRMPPALIAAWWGCAGVFAVIWGAEQLRTPSLSSALTLILGAIAVISPFAMVSMRWRRWLWSGLFSVSVIALLASVVRFLLGGGPPTSPLVEALAPIVDLRQPGFSLGWPMVLLFLFDPAWIPGVRPDAERWTFYDGHCGLCHRAVRFLLAEDDCGRLRYSPLQGETIREKLTGEVREALPDSIVLWEGGNLTTRFAAVRQLLLALGGLWRVIGIALYAVPTPLGNAVYDGIAGIRHRLFKQPEAACPFLPPDLRSRFGA
ncbi:MAG: DCC1-like thiol-disulfide oxidoreductase family protein [Planctomycetota bacterium]